MSRGIPSVRTWKVTSVETGLVIYIDTINKKFALWIARTERGMGWQELKVSVVKEPKRHGVPYGAQG